MTRSSLGCLSIFVTLLLIVSLLLNGIFFAAYSLHGSRRDNGEETFNERFVTGDSSSTNKIVLIDLRGLIATEDRGEFGDDMVDDIRLQLRSAMLDKSVKGVVLRIDSPGGEVTASDEIYHYLARFRESKPITIYMESVAASGGYYSAMGGSWIVANQLSLTGSIGVILETFNVQDLLGKIGVKALVIKSGKMKDLLSPFRATTPDEIAFIQHLINDTYDRFVGVVAKERHLDVNVLRNGIADGRVLSGAEAQSAGLVDQLGYLEDAIKKERELCKIDNAKVIRYEAPVDFSKLLSLVATSPVRSLKVEMPGGGMSAALPLRSGKLYYLPVTTVGL